MSSHARRNITKAVERAGCVIKELTWNPRKNPDQEDEIFGWYLVMVDEEDDRYEIELESQWWQGLVFEIDLFSLEEDEG